MTHQTNTRRLPRETCPVCLREVAVRRGGELREHGDNPGAGDKCPASGYTVTEALRRQEAELDAIRGIG